MRVSQGLAVLLLVCSCVASSCDSTSFPAPSEFSGSPATVATSGNFVMVGYPLDSGHVEIYECDSTSTWQQSFSFTFGNTSGLPSHSKCGTSVAITDRTPSPQAFISCPGSRQVLVYSLENGEWDFVHSIDGAPGASNITYGASMDVAVGSASSGSSKAFLVVSDPGGGGTGQVMVYTSQASPIYWEFNAVLMMPPEQQTTYSSFGTSVSLSNSATVLAVGAPWSQTSGPGAVFLFDSFVERHSFQFIKMLEGSENQDLFGYSVSAFGSTAEAGVAKWKQNGFIAGAPNANEALIWSRETYDLSGVQYNQYVNSTQADVKFGQAVAVDKSSEGSCVLPVVAAMGTESGTGFVSALAYPNGWGSPWATYDSISAPASAKSFGMSVSVSSGTVAIGSYGELTIWQTAVPCT